MEAFKNQCSEGTSTQAEHKSNQKNSVAGCLISDLDINFFTFRDLVYMLFQIPI